VPGGAYHRQRVEVLDRVDDLDELEST